jgi:hypothetical protein
MTSVEVEAGVCGFLTRLQATSRAEGDVAIGGESECPRVQEYLANLGAIEVSAALGRCCIEKVFQPSTKAGLHPACPVPVGVLKAVEVAAGLALPRTVTIRFVE